MTNAGSDARSDRPFRWACLGVAVAFLVAIGWMVNDMRLVVRRTSESVKEASQKINENLPEILARSRETTAVAKNLPQVLEKVKGTTDTLSESLPEIVDRVDRTTEVVAELAEDIRQLKELAGVTSGKRDENLIAYGNSVLKAIEASGGSVGVKKLTGRGLKNAVPAVEWVAGARKEAVLLAIVSKSKKEMLTRLGKTKLGLNWYLEMPGKDPVPLIEWLKEHHAETRALG